MHSKKGFTLIEVLIVVAISLSVLIFAVPAYKKTQAKAKFEAAQGVMISMGTAVNLVREKIYEVNGDCGNACKFPTTTKKIEVTSTASEDESRDYAAKSVSDDNRIKSMFAQKIAPLIPFDDTSSKSYKGYYVYICQEGGSGSQCCVNTNAIACIQLKNTPTDIDKPFYRAYYTKDGEIVKLAKD